MIKASHAESDSDTAAGAKSRNLECWSRDAQARALRVELGGGSWFIFSYSHFLFASLEPAEDQDVLRISFATHDVRVRGRGLMTLLSAVQEIVD